MLRNFIDSKPEGTSTGSVSITELSATRRVDGMRESASTARRR